MSLTNPNTPISEQDLQDFYHKIKPYLGIDEMPSADMSEIVTPLPGVMARSIYNSRFNRSDMYDTNEVLIGKWIDGKPLYQKTVSCGALPNATEKTISSGLTNVNVVNIFGTAVKSSNSKPLPYASLTNTTYNINVEYDTSQNKIVIATGIDRSDMNGYVTIQYTKTTDGVTKVDFDTDYSTDETIVGRWIDGKPVYQKTVLCSCASNITDGTPKIGYTAHGISNRDTLVDLSMSGGTSGTRLWKNSNVIYYYCAYVDSNNIAIETNVGALSDRQFYVTLQYTKTTD